MTNKTLSKPGVSGSNLPFFALIFLLACSGAGVALSQTELSSTTQSAAARQAQALPAAPPDVDAYILQRGDNLEIKVFNLSELNEKVTIRPDGKISILLLNDVVAAGLTATQLSDFLITRYSQFYKKPKVTVIVRSFANQKVYVAGEVFKQGLFDLVGELTAVGAITQAGGLRETAKVDNIILLRNSGTSHPLVIKLNLKEVINRGKPDVKLMALDVVYVPKRTIAKLNEFTKLYIRELLPISVNLGFAYILGQPGEFRQEVVPK